jgi:2,3-bisphosphoglycerate-independent phosphoglycerate mutase
MEPEVTKAVEVVRKVVYERKGIKAFGPTYKAMRMVLVVNNDGNVRICTRENKVEGEKEILLLRKQELREGGLSSAYWERVIQKVAAVLEKHKIIGKRKLQSTAGQMPLWEK